MQRFVSGLHTQSVTLCHVKFSTRTEKSWQNVSVQCVHTLAQPFHSNVCQPEPSPTLLRGSIQDQCLQSNVEPPIVAFEGIIHAVTSIFRRLS